MNALFKLTDRINITDFFTFSKAQTNWHDDYLNVEESYKTLYPNLPKDNSCDWNYCNTSRNNKMAAYLTIGAQTSAFEKRVWESAVCGQ